MRARPIATATLLAVAISAPAGVRARPRPRFEPTDLHWTDTGVADADLEFGVIRGPSTGRLVVPDFELSLGVLDNLELDLDGTYTLESSVPGSFAFDLPVPSALWPSVKIGFYNDHDYETGRAQAVGMQIGPKIPVAGGTHGVGGEGLLVLGGSMKGLNLTFNLGGFVEPPPDAVSPYSVGVEAGIDLDLVLDSRERFHLTSELASVYFFTQDPSQIHVTGGISWSVHPNLDLSVVGIYGFLEGDDHYGVLFGMDPKIRLFDAPPRYKEAQ